MKKILIPLLILFLPIPGLGSDNTGGTADEDSLTIEQAKQIAIENNPGVRQALARIRSAKAILGQAYASWFPTISAGGGYFYRHVDMQPDWQPDIRVKEDLHETSGNLELNWLLFNGFARRAQTLAAGHGVEQAQQTHANAQRLLMESVAAAFYQAQLAKENMHIASQNASFNRALERNAKIRREIGSAPRSEMLNFSIRAVQAESDSIEAGRNLTIASTVLAELLGLPDTGQAGDLRLVVAGDITDTIPPYEELLAVALENRPDLLAIDAGIAAAEQQKNAVKGSWLPSIGITAGLNYTKQEKVDPVQEERDRYAGVTAQWELFSGGRRKAEFQEKKAEILALMEEKRRTILSIQSGIRQAITNAKAAEKQWKRQKEAYAMTQQVRHDIELLYNTGSARLTRLNEAQTDLVRAASLAASSKVQFLLALDRLETESGRVPTP